MFPPRGFKTFVKAHGLGGLVIAAACPTGPGPVYRQESRRGQVSGQLDARACPGKMREARVTASRGASWWEQEPARPVVSRPGEKVQAGQRGRSSVRRGGGRGREEGGGEADSSPPTMPTSSEPGHVAPREGACRCDELRALGMGRASWILSGPDATRGPYEGKAGETRPGRPRDDGSSLG